MTRIYANGSRLLIDDGTYVSEILLVSFDFKITASSPSDILTISDKLGAHKDITLNVSEIADENGLLVGTTVDATNYLDNIKTGGVVSPVIPDDIPVLEFDPDPEGSILVWYNSLEGKMKSWDGGEKDFFKEGDLTDVFGTEISI